MERRNSRREDEAPTRSGIAYLADITGAYPL